MKKSTGFTLLELMIVGAIIAVLAGLAFSAYNEQTRKSRRAEAKQMLSDLALRQEKWRSNHAAYGSLTDLVGAATLASPSGFYTMSAITFAPAGGNCAGGQAVGSANSYVLTATTAGIQASDLKCATLTLSNYCGTVSKTWTGASSTSCW